MGSTGKTRYWTFLVYKESAIENWQEFLKELCIPVCISPYHDKDTNPDDTLKKPHWHVIVCFEGPTTYKNVLENVCEPIGATIPKRVMSLRGMYRYLIHLDNPEKYQYNKDEIIEFGDFKIELTDTEINMIKIAIIRDIEQHSIMSYNELCDYYIELGLYDEFSVVAKHVMFFKTYIADNNRKLRK